MDVLRIILNSIQLLTFIIAFIYCKNLKKGIYLRSYFLFIIFSEIIGKLLEVCSLFEFNKLWYNFIVIPAEFFFWYWYMLQQFKEKKEILFVKSGIIILTLSFVFEWLFFYDTKTVFISLSYTLGNLIFLVFILMYFKNFLLSFCLAIFLSIDCRNMKYIYNFQKSSYFRT